jgi:hypothetical protein
VRVKSDSSNSADGKSDDNMVARMFLVGVEINWVWRGMAQVPAAARNSNNSCSVFVRALFLWVKGRSKCCALAHGKTKSLGIASIQQRLNRTNNQLGGCGARACTRPLAATRGRGCWLLHLAFGYRNYSFHPHGMTFFVVRATSRQALMRRRLAPKFSPPARRKGCRHDAALEQHRICMEPVVEPH